VHTGVHVGDDLETYLAAARQSREQNITLFDEPLKKIVCVMQGDEFFSTWVANKAVYRTRMALADGGELVIIAPGLERFGEQPEVDRIIRRVGYVGTPKVIKPATTTDGENWSGRGVSTIVRGAITTASVGYWSPRSRRHCRRASSGSRPR